MNPAIDTYNKTLNEGDHLSSLGGSPSCQRCDRASGFYKRCLSSFRLRNPTAVRALANQISICVFVFVPGVLDRSRFPLLIVTDADDRPTLLRMIQTCGGSCRTSAMSLQSSSDSGRSELTTMSAAATFSSQSFVTLVLCPMVLPWPGVMHRLTQVGVSVRRRFSLPYRHMLEAHAT